MMARRVRREFGAPYHFTDRNVADAKDGHVECSPYQDGSYDLKKIELDKGTQVGDSWCIWVHTLPKKFITNHFHQLLHCSVGIFIKSITGFRS